MNAVLGHAGGMVFAGTGENNEADLPARLSPSRLSDFRQCPAKFYFGSICRLPRLATEATTVGTLAHEAFELLFDHPRGERTVDVAVSYVRPAWERIREETNYDAVRHLGEELVARAEEMVSRWFSVENPNKFDPTGREMRLETEIEGVPLLGILDRVDHVQAEDGERVYISDYKGLALDTPLATPGGWTTMSEVQVGDEVFASDGSVTKVILKSEIHNRPCYDVMFADGSVVTADNVHLWGVMNDGVYEVLSTEELAARLGAGRRLLVPRRRALDLPANGAEIKAAVRWMENGCRTGDTDASAGRALARGSVNERAMLLSEFSDRHGVIEQDGEWGIHTFTGLDVAVVEFLEELCATMSWPCERVPEGNAWGFEFLPEVLQWEIESVTPRESVPTQCIQVDSPAALYLAGRGMVVTHNTGKVPSPTDRFLDEKFFAMRAYAMLWKENHGTVPHQLRLVYVAGGTRDSVRAKNVDEKLIKATKKELKTMVREIKECATKGEWECRKHVLCQWCDFIDVCPLYHSELAGIPVGEIKARFADGSLSD